jgi:hypothetical protein
LEALDECCGKFWTDLKRCAAVKGITLKENKTNNSYFIQSQNLTV